MLLRHHSPKQLPVLKKECLNGGINRSDGSCDCSTAIETLTDCSHSGGLGNMNYSGYTGNGAGSDGRQGGKNFNVQFTGELCEIPGKLPNNFVKWLNHNGNPQLKYTNQTEDRNCLVTRECLGDTTQCVPDNWTCCLGDAWTCALPYNIDGNTCHNNGTICGTNINGLDHQCTT